MKKFLSYNIAFFLFSILQSPVGKTCIIENSSGTVSLENPVINISCD